MHCLAVDTRTSQLSLEKSSDQKENNTKVCSTLNEILQNDLLSVIQSQIEAITEAQQSFQAPVIGELDRLNSRLKLIEDGETDVLRATSEANAALLRYVNQLIEVRTLDNNEMSLCFTRVANRMLTLEAPPQFVKVLSQKD